MYNTIYKMYQSIIPLTIFYNATYKYYITCTLDRETFVVKNFPQPLPTAKIKQAQHFLFDKQLDIFHTCTLRQRVTATKIKQCEN